MEKEGPPLSVDDYKVAWIAALHVELAAACVMLDEEHPLPHDFEPDTNDDNLYTFGRIGSHNVVLACLASGIYGTISAAWTAAHLVGRFPSLKAGLLVGIGGGVPSDDVDIRLGDVAVSLPSSNLAGVVQYDMGKQLADARFQRTGHLNSPPSLLLKAIAQMRAREGLGQNPIAQHLSVFDLLPGHGFRRKMAGDDVLYQEDGSAKARPARASSDPVCHYGTIASGDLVMKNGTLRDQISKELGGVICFEMEAAGIMNNFPSLVIRGICDYADSHKNKVWQPYAAATAAAYAKSLLSVIPAVNAERAETVSENMELGPPRAMGASKRLEMTAEEQLQLHGGPRRGGVKKSVRGVIEDEPAPIDTEAVDAPIDQKEEQSRFLKRLRELSSSRAGFSLFNRTMHFYGEVYLGNGTVMRSIINNQGGTIRNSGGAMNLVGNVGGSMHSGNRTSRGVRGYTTPAYQSMPGLQPLRRVLKLPFWRRFKGR